MKKTILLSLLLFFCTLATFCQTSRDSLELIMKQANAEYQKNNFESAIDLYLKIIDNQYESPILYYNLGNAYYKNKENAQALLWLERAARLDPSNDDIKHNILYINQKLTDKIDILPEIFIVRWWKSLAATCSGKGWAIWSIIFAILFCTSIITILLTKRAYGRTISTIIAILSLFAIVFTILFAHRQTYYYTKNPEAIVMQSVINAKSTPNDSGTALFVIHEGLKVKVTDIVGEWIEIKIPNGEKGWVLQNEVEII